MISLPFYVICMFGLAYILGHSIVTRSAREALAGPDLMRCDACGQVVPATGIQECRQCGAGHYRELLSPRRWLVMLIECPACLGFWLGVLAALGGITPAFVDAQLWAVALAWGLFTAGSNFALSKWTGLL